MSGSKHISWGSLVEEAECTLLEGGRGSRLASQERDHLEHCDHCARTMSEIRRLLGAIDFAAVGEIPAELRQRTWERLERLRGTPATVRRPESPGEGDSLEGAQSFWEGLSEVVATWVSGSGELALAVRSSSTATPHILVFETEAYGVTLSVQTPASPGRPAESVHQDLLGRIVPKRSSVLPPGGRVRVLSPHGAMETLVEEYGGFRFSNVDLHDLRVEIALGDQKIILPHVRQRDED